MRLDELVWYAGDNFSWADATASVRVVKDQWGYTILRHTPTTPPEHWFKLDPITAQAVLFELTCGGNDAAG